jgi:NAD(P)-dependent dehydrogenase (short-subunit alcohol dehydrogenase family)
MSDPDGQAAVVEVLLSDDASFVTGSAVMVDGGYTAT